MTEQGQILNFPANLADDIESLDLLSIEDFDSDFVLRDFMDANCNKNIGTTLVRKQLRFYNQWLTQYYVGTITKNKVRS